MNLTNHFIILLLLASARLAAQPENFRFVNFSAKDGLPDKYVYCAEQDNRGYLWFGTGTGLYRYDGHSFKQFRSTADKPGRSTANILQALHKDESGNLWLGSLNAIQWYNPEKNNFWAPDYSRPEIKKVCDAYIYNFSKGSHGTVWLSSSKNYFFRFNPKDSSFTHFNAYPSSASVSAIKVYEIKGIVYAIHSEGVYLFSPDGSFISFSGFPGNFISNASLAKNGDQLYLTTLAGGLIRFNPATKTFKDDLFGNDQLKKHNLFCVKETEDGNIFIGGYPLHFLNLEKKEYTFISNNKKEEYEINATKTVQLFSDREKNIWICSHNGLSMLPWQNQQVSTVEIKDAVSGNVVEPFGVFSQPRSNNLLITNTTTSGLVVYDQITGKISTIENKYGNTIEEKRITGLIIAPDSSIYLSNDSLLFKYMPEQKKIGLFTLKDQYDKPISMVGRNVFDKKGNIYITSDNNGFYIWNYPNSKLTHINRWDVDKEDTSHSDNNIAPCYIDKKGQCWFTGNNGVYRYDPAENRYYHLAYKDHSGIPPAGATSYIAEDIKGHIWIATVSNGLYELYFENGKEILKNYTRNSGIGLPSDYCWKIKQSPVDSCFWISNISGLLKFDPVQKRVLTVFNRQNGLMGDDGGYSFNITPSNKLIQLYYGYINILDLNTYWENKILPVIQFNSIKVLDKEYSYDIVAEQPELVLKYNQNYFQFEFTALVLNNSNKNQYAWQLAGVDKGWIYGGQENKISYSLLKPGTYYFKVKAANSDGYWGNEKIIKLIIRPPFYATWWFLGLFLLATAGLLFTWNHYRVSRARKEEKLKATYQQQIAETEMKALRAQMNPHFIFNSLNSIQKYILKNEHFEASQYLTKFSRLIRLILDHSNQNTILLSSELDLLKLYVEMESLRFDDQFDYAIKTDDNINAETIELPSMLIQPYVENAIWHGLLHKDTRGKLEIRFSKDSNNNLSVTIDDDGIGREKAAELKSKQVLKKKSYGMQITEDRLAIINRTQHINATCEIIDKKDHKGNAAGTVVKLIIPVKKITN